VSLRKYFSEQDPDKHGGSLFWSGNLEVPFRGERPPTLARHELEEQVEVHSDYYVRDFDLSLPDDVKAYREVMDRVMNGGWYRVIDKDRQFIKETKSWLVHLEWIQQYGGLTPTAAPALSSQGYTTVPTSVSAMPLAGELQYSPNGEERLVQWPRQP
jgi:hypothetical protein